MGGQAIAAAYLAGRSSVLLPRVKETWVNDLHAQLNRTRVDEIRTPASTGEVQSLVERARAKQTCLSIAGGRHAMGGQQFGTDSILMDMRGLDQVLDFDAERGLIEVGAGIQWPELVEALASRQEGIEDAWGIIQKQTGADRLSLGGALAANAHGRGLRFRPIIDDVESFELVDAEGRVRHCSREENQELFRLAIGGYGCFGLIASIRLRLRRRQRVERVVEIIESEDLMTRFQERINEGYLFGDFQYATELSEGRMFRKGVFSCYRPTTRPVQSESQKQMSPEDWSKLLYLAHADRRKGFEMYSSYYLSTSGQVYWSDTHQMSTYLDDYHKSLDRQLCSKTKGSEMITEIYVPRKKLSEFMADVRRDFLRHGVKLIYGTIRLIEKDAESFLAWAREPWVCVIFNLHLDHDPAGMAKGRRDFRRLIDRGISYGGSYFLTYHRWATRDQVLSCYPQFPEFLKLKGKYDPQDRFQSDWYRHYREMFADLL
jgi:FAD/FMN-containing dehydrogenase